jgi:hypothetical protein
MEHAMFFSILLVSLLFHSADAADSQLQPQVAVSAQGSHELRKDVTLRGSGHAFWVPQEAGTDDAVIGMVYVGPKFMMNDHYSIAPQLGAIVNWTGEGDVMPIVSAWNWIDVKHFHAFIEAEIYPNFTTGDVVYYGFYGLDYDRLRLVWIGVHLEQVGTGLNVGPHIGIPLGNVQVQVNYHRGQDGSDTIRLGFNL